MLRLLDKAVAPYPTIMSPSPTQTYHGMSSEKHTDWRRVLMTPEERAAYIDRHYEVNEETGEIIAPKKTLYQEAVARGKDWREGHIDIDEFESRLTLELPASFLAEQSDLDIER